MVIAKTAFGPANLGSLDREMVLISEFISLDPFRSSNPTVRSLGYCYAPATAWHLFVGAEPQFVG
jgi:hypothetical protein